MACFNLDMRRPKRAPQPSSPRSWETWGIRQFHRSRHVLFGARRFMFWSILLRCAILLTIARARALFQITAPPLPVLAFTILAGLAAGSWFGFGKILASSAAFTSRANRRIRMLTAGQSCTIHPPVQLNFVAARATGRTPSVTDGDPLRCRIEIRAMPERVPKAAKHNLRRLSWRFTDTRVAFPTRMHPHLPQARRGESHPVHRPSEVSCSSCAATFYLV
jgi:hypothetical protein